MATIKQTHQILDTETGEVRESTLIQNIKLVKEPNFVKVYLDDILTITGLSNSHGSVLFALIREMNYKNLIYVSGSLRKGISDELGISPVTLTKALEKFIQEGIFTRQERGVYLVNPWLFGKGSWKDIKSIRMTIDYAEGKKTIKSDITFNESAERFNSLQSKLDSIDNE